MRWRPTIYLGRWAGVEIRLDLILVILIGLLFFSSLNDAQARNAPAGEVWTAIAHLVLLLVMVACMFLHEVGHAFVCKLRGHEPRMILLSFVGLTFFKAGKVKPIIDRCYPLAETADAFRYLEEGHAKGKIVISVIPGDAARTQGHAERSVA